MWGQQTHHPALEWLAGLVSLRLLGSLLFAEQSKSYVNVLGKNCTFGTTSWNCLPLWTGGQESQRVRCLQQASRAVRDQPGQTGDGGDCCLASIWVGFPHRPRDMPCVHMHLHAGVYFFLF